MFVTQDTCEEIGWDQSVHVPEEQQSPGKGTFVRKDLMLLFYCPPQNKRKQNQTNL